MDDELNKEDHCPGTCRRIMEEEVYVDYGEKMHGPATSALTNQIYFEYTEWR